MSISIILGCGLLALVILFIGKSIYRAIRLTLFIKKLSEFFRMCLNFQLQPNNRKLKFDELGIKHQIGPSTLHLHSFEFVDMSDNVMGEFVLDLDKMSWENDKGLFQLISENLYEIGMIKQILPFEEMVKYYSEE